MGPLEVVAHVLVLSLITIYFCPGQEQLQGWLA
jgi:hypothetical protein